MNKDADSNTTFKFLNASLLVDPIKPYPTIQLPHNAILAKGPLARYNFTSVELKTFTFRGGAQSLSMDHAVLGHVPKRLLITLVQNTEFFCSTNTKIYYFRHYTLSSFPLKVNDKQIPSKTWL